MNQPLPYEQALERHPEQVADVIRQVRKGRSKTKNTDPSTWTWSYTWCVEIHGCSIEDMFREAGREKPVLSLEERVDDLLRRSHVALSGHTRSSDVSSEVLRDHYTRSVTEEMTEEARIAALSPAERDQQVQDALRYLTGPKNKGFVAIHFPSPQREKV